jgi:hypothetical protein
MVKADPVVLRAFSKTLYGKGGKTIRKLADGELGFIVLNCEATASTPEEMKVLIAAYKAGGRFAGCEVLQVKRGDLGENFTIPYACGSDVKTIELMVLDDQFRPANLKILLAQ